VFVVIIGLRILCNFSAREKVHEEFSTTSLFLDHHHYQVWPIKMGSNMGNPLLKVARFVADASITKYNGATLLAINDVIRAKVT